MKKKEIILILVAVILFCTGAVTMVFKSAVKSAAHALEIAFPNAVKASGKEIVEDTIDLSEFKELKVDVSAMNTYIETGDSYKLEYRVREDYIPNIEEKGDKLTIKQPSHFGITLHGLFDSEDEYCRRSLPKDAGMLEFDVESSSGTVSVEDLQINGKIEISSGEIVLNNIEGDELKLEASSGSIDLKDVNTKKLKLKITSGGVQAEYCNTDKLEADMTSGNMNLEDLKFSKAAFDMTSGNVEAEVLGSEKDYSYNLKSTSGDLRINGKSYDDDYRSGDDKDHMITVDMTSGNFDLSFAE